MIQPVPEYTVEIAPGADLSADPSTWTWLDITGDVRTKQAITMVRGLRDEGRRADPSTMDLTINNRDGRYSPRNASSDLFGLIRRNTPIRLRMASVSSDDVFSGYIPEWPTRWSRGGTDSWVPLKAAGILRRLQQGAPPVRSALEMAISTHARIAAFGATDPALKAYWTMEEMANATASIGTFPPHHELDDANLGDMSVTTASTLSSASALGSQAIPSFPTEVVTFLSQYDLTPFENGIWRFDCLAIVPELPGSGQSTVLGLALDASDEWASTPDHSSLDIIGDIDLRVEATLDDWSSGGLQNLIAKNAETTQRSYRLRIDAAGTVRLVWSVAGTTVVSRASTVAVPFANGARGAVRATLDVDNGAAGHTVTFYTASSIDGTWTQLGSQVVTAGVTSIFSGTGGLVVGTAADTGGIDPAVGIIHRAQVFSGLGGIDLRANPNFTDVEAGTTSFSDSTGKTWTLQGDAEITRTPYLTNLVNIFTTGSLTNQHLRFRLAETGALSVEAIVSAELSVSFTPTFEIVGRPILLSLVVNTATNGVTFIVSQALRGSTIVSESATGTATVAIGNPRNHDVPTGPGPLVIDAVARHIPIALGHFAISQSTEVAAGPGVILPARPTLAELAPWTNLNLSALNGWDGEPAGLRLIRVTHDSGVPFELVDNPGVETTNAIPTRRMGPQPSATLVSVLAECPDVDGGLLFERGFGLGYRRRTDQINQAPVLRLEQGQLFEAPQPTDDDQQLMNLIRVEGPDGIGVVVKDLTSLAAEGDYGISVRRNGYDINVLRSIGNDLLRVGTTDEMRWPSIVFLPSAQHMIAERLNLIEGRMITLAHEWAQLNGVTPTDLIVQGWTDTITRERWLVELNCVPASPWQLPEESMSLIAYQENRSKIAYTTTPSEPDTLFTIVDVPLEAGFNYLIVGETKAGHDGTNALAVGTMAEINLYRDTTRIARSYHRPDSGFIISTPGFQQRCQVQRTGVTVVSSGTFDISLRVRPLNIGTDPIEIGCEATEPFEEANWLAVYRVGEVA